MTGQAVFTLHERRWNLAQDDGGHVIWRKEIAVRSIQARRTAIIVCDMWDRHWSRGAAERVAALAPRMDVVLAAARNKGALIIHAPSETLAFYENSPARRRILVLPPLEPPEGTEFPVPPMPIDASEGGSDTGEKEVHYPWTRQHAAIEIDEDRDLISDNGLEVYAALGHYDIGQVVIMGVHTNMCVLNRSFAIKQLVCWNVPVVLVRDLTDAMYNPAKPPYVSHDEGTQIVIGYIERFWCPTISSVDLLS
jgi:nicotinamidase-related amidase